MKLTVLVLFLVVACHAETLAQWAMRTATPIGYVDDPKAVEVDKAVAATLAGRKNLQVVGLGEGAHGTHEFSVLRTRVLSALIRNHGLRVITPETGIIEARLVDRYVMGENVGTIDYVLLNGLTHMMGMWEEMKETVEMIRTWNMKQPLEKRVHFAGKDLPRLGDSVTVALDPLVEYLRRVDQPFAQSKLITDTYALAKTSVALTLKVDEIYRKHGAEGIDPDYLDAFSQISFELLSQQDQAALEQGLTSIQRALEANASAYAALSSEDEALWNVRVAVVATQLMRNLRSRQVHLKVAFFQEAVALLKTAGIEVPYDARHVINVTMEEDWRDQFIGRNSRELALAENVMYLFQRYNGLVMNFAHNGHLHKLPLKQAIVGDIVIHDPGTNEGCFIVQALGPSYLLFGATNSEFVNDTLAKSPTDRLRDWPKSFEFEVDPVVQARKGRGSGIFLDLSHDVPAEPASHLGPRYRRWQLSFQEFEVIANYDGYFIFDLVADGRRL